MATIRIEADFTYDADIMHGKDLTAIAWFVNMLTVEGEDELTVHSAEIGDVIGTLKVIRVEGEIK